MENNGGKTTQADGGIGRRRKNSIIPPPIVIPKVQLSSRSRKGEEVAPLPSPIMYSGLAHECIIPGNPMTLGPAVPMPQGFYFEESISNSCCSKYPVASTPIPIPSMPVLMGPYTTTTTTHQQDIIIQGSPLTPIGPGMSHGFIFGPTGFNNFGPFPPPAILIPMVQLPPGHAQGSPIKYSGLQEFIMPVPGPPLTLTPSPSGSEGCCDDYSGNNFRPEYYGSSPPLYAYSCLPPQEFIPGTPLTMTPTPTGSGEFYFNDCSGNDFHPEYSGSSPAPPTIFIPMGQLPYGHNGGGTQGSALPQELTPSPTGSLKHYRDNCSGRNFHSEQSQPIIPIPAGASRHQKVLVEAEAADSKPADAVDNTNTNAQPKKKKSGKRRNKNRNYPPAELRCGFCVKNRERFEFFSSHRVRDKNGVTTCPVLRRFTCPLCQATGDKAHTAGHCPTNKSEVRAEFRNRFGPASLENRGRRNARGIIGAYSYS